MTISTRTPEGYPKQCPICGRPFLLEPSQPAGDAPCPNCGHLLWWFQEKFSEPLTMPREAIAADTMFEDLYSDSLDAVELIMELEEEFDVTFPDAEAWKEIKTVGDAIRYIETHRAGKQ